MALVQPDLDGFQIKHVRKALRLLILAAAPQATVHVEWKLEFDTAGLGKITNNLKGQGDHAEFVHCWMIGLENETPETVNGVDRYGGKSKSIYVLSFAVWGFFEYRGWRSQFGDGTAVAETDENDPTAIEDENTTDFAEREHRSIKGFIRKNPRLDLEYNIQAMPFAVSNQDVYGFSGGQKVLVLQGSQSVRVKENF